MEQQTESRLLRATVHSTLADPSWETLHKRACNTKQTGQTLAASHTSPDQWGPRTRNSISIQPIFTFPIRTKPGPISYVLFNVFNDQASFLRKGS